MLSRKNVKPSRSKQLLFIPLLLIAAACFKKEAPVDNKKYIDGNKVTYRGNVLEMKIYTPDTIVVEDPFTGEQTLSVVSRDPRPQKLNGKEIYLEEKTHTPPEFSDKNLWAYVMKGLEKDMGKLHDGSYGLLVTNIVMDDKGSIAYFDFSGVGAHYSGGKDGKQLDSLDLDKKKEISNKLGALMHDAPRKQPAKVNGRNVACLMENGPFDNPVVVKGGKVVSF